MIEALHNSEFMQVLGGSVSQIITLIPEDPSLRKQRAFRRPLSADEEHVKRTLISADELIKVCDQMTYIVEFLSGFRARKAPSVSSPTRLDYMVYHIENYFIRSNMVMDRALQLVNAVFRLGIPERECRFAVVALNEHLGKTEAGQCLKELEDILKPYRPYRNTIIHRRRYTDNSLEGVEPLYILEKIDLDDSEEDFIGQYHDLRKLLTDRVVREKKMEFTENNQAVFTKVAELFASLVPVFEGTQAALKDVA